MAKHDGVKDAALRALFDSAFASLRGGAPSDAVRTLADAFLGMLRDHPSLLGERRDRHNRTSDFLKD